MEPWLYELDIRHYVTPTKKCIQGNKTMYLLKIDDDYMVYSHTEYPESDMITYHLRPGSFMPERYRVELGEDDCPDLNIVISLYLCYLQCSLSSISITTSAHGQTAGNEMMTFSGIKELNTLEKSSTDMFSLFDKEVKTETETEKPFSFKEETWDEKPSWQQ